MLKVNFSYDLPTYDPDKHDPDKTFAFMTYRGVHYAKWVYLKSRGIPSWNVSLDKTE
jgi:hypothetical protein